MANLDKIITFFFVVSSRNSFVDIINSKKNSKSHTLCIGPPWMRLCLTSGLYMYYYNHHQSKIAIYRLQRWGCGVNSLHDAKIL